MHTPESILKQYWGYSSFREYQRQIIESVLQKRDTIAMLPTGGGKSVCYQVPTLMQEGITLVVTPLIALMKDQVAQLKSKGILAQAIYSGMTHREIDIALDNCVYGKVKFLYVSPERLRSELFIERLKKMNVQLLAVDEAHCISQWGYDFRPSYLHISDIRDLMPKVPVLAVTATATQTVRQDIATQLKLNDPAVLIGAFDRPNLSYSCFSEEDKEAKLLKVLKAVPGTAIVYCSTRKKTIELSSLLNKQKISSGYYHAGLANKERAFRQEAWMSGKIRVMVATNAFGMGIDKSDVHLVVHFGIPSSIEAYYQEAGRAGRNGKKAYAVLIYHPSDCTDGEFLIKQQYPSLQSIQRVYQALGSYLKLAVGSGEHESFDFDVELFCQSFQLQVAETYRSLKLLERQNILLLSDSFYQPSRIRFLMQGQDLYAFQVKKDTWDDFIKGLLRLFGGELFTGYVYLQEDVVARKLGMTASQFVAKLRVLATSKVIDYLPVKDKPQITFLTPRLRSADLPVLLSSVQDLKERDLQNWKHMMDYLGSSNRCRSVLLAQYFGQELKDCGICDNCLSKLHADKIHEDKKLVLQWLIDHPGTSMQDVSKAFAHIKDVDMKKILHELIHSEQILVQKDGTLLVC